VQRTLGRRTIREPDNGRYSTLRDQIHEQLQRAPLNETMHKLFRRIVDEAG
jgi:hypothetical protein